MTSSKAGGGLIGRVVRLDWLTGRWPIKGAFLAFFLWACTRLLGFMAWARGQGPWVPRPESVAGLLPVGHFTSFFAWIRGGGWDTLLPAGPVMIIGALAVSLLFRRGFCGWICPLGTIWEGVAAMGRRVFGRTFAPPRWLDLAGKVLRYLIAGVAVFLLFSVPLAEAVGFRRLPYMWVADIKILQGFTNPTFLAIFAISLAATLFIGPFWCRYLCPLGGLYSAVGLGSPCGVKRIEERCTHCHACTRVCHAMIDVESTAAVRSPECDGCLECVRTCPAEGCLTARAFGRLVIAPWAWPLLAAGLWIAIWVVAKAAGYWDTGLPPDLFRQVINSGLLEQRTPGFLR